MPSESERVVTAYFHAVRAARKRASVDSAELDKLATVVIERARLEQRADRDAYERQCD